MNKRFYIIKLIHTVIWLFYVFLIGYILYAGVFNKIDINLLIAFGFMILEGLILIYFRWKCPLAIISYKYSDNHEAGFDLFIPKWLARNNMMICVTLLAVGLLITCYRLIDIN